MELPDLRLYTIAATGVAVVWEEAAVLARRIYTPPPHFSPGRRGHAVRQQLDRNPQECVDGLGACVHIVLRAPFKCIDVVV